MMGYLGSLAERNSQILTSLLGDQYIKHSYDDSLSTDTFHQANEELSTQLYGAEVASLVRSGDIQGLDAMQVDVMGSTLASEELLEPITLSRIGLVVIRPELLGLADECAHLLERAELQVIFDKTSRIDFKQYWSLYGAGLRDPESRHDFPTRTLNYIGHDIRLFVVSADVGNLSKPTVSDYITRELKGRQGSYSAGTLRGGLAYLALRELVTIDGRGFVSGTANMALDPIGAYRHLVRGDVESDRMHDAADTPILFYAGQAIHVPTNAELGRDLRVFCNDDELSLIAERVLLDAESS